MITFNILDQPYMKDMNVYDREANVMDHVNDLSKDQPKLIQYDESDDELENSINWDF